MKFRIKVPSGVKGGIWDAGPYRKVHKLLFAMFYFLSWGVATRVFIEVLIVLF